MIPNWRVPMIRGLLCGLMIVFLSHQAHSAKPITGEQIHQTLSGNSLKRRQQLLDQLMYVETLDGRQSSALAEFVAISLREENQLTGPDLQALYLLQRADDSSHVSTFENGLSHVDPRAVQLSLDGLARLKPDAVFDKLPQLTQHQAYKSSYGFRRAVIETVAAYGAESSIEFLIDQLPSLDGQLEYLTVLHLQRLTGQVFTNSADDWKKWWSSVGPDDRGPPTEQQQKQIAQQKLIGQWNGAVPEFFDMPLFAKKIVFIIDNSASMKSTLEGEMRIERAQKELSEAIEKMAPDVQFNIIAFNHRIETWQRSLQPANSSAKAAAVQYGYAMAPFGKTASYDALSLGLSFDPNTELVVFLSDGKPTAGTIVEPLIILQAIWKQNLFQRTSIYTLGIDTRDETEEFMEYLAEQNYGMYTKIR